MKNLHPMLFGEDRGVIVQCAGCGTVYERSGFMSVCPYCDSKLEL